MEFIKNEIENEMKDKTQIYSFLNFYGANRKFNTKRWWYGMILIIGGTIFLPWTQSIRSKGIVTTLRQEHRPQKLNSIISGRIIKWWVKEGDYVKKGDTILQLAEIKDEYLDPQLLIRTNTQLSAKVSSLEGYRNKLSSTIQQIDALQQSRELKLSDIDNKLQQQLQKIRIDSVDLIATVNDYSIKAEQLKRQQQLFDKGIVSKVQLEQRNQALQDAIAKRNSNELKLSNARQEFNRLLIEKKSENQQYIEKITKAEGDKFQTMSIIANAEGDIAKTENQLSNYTFRSGQYIITAPQDGQISKVKKAGINEIVKEAETLAEIVPTDQQKAVELFVSPNDIPLLSTYQKVNFWFDGFPAIVFSGWPNMSFGIFKGEIIAIENNISDNGYYRVLVVEDMSAKKKWPSFLKIGTGAKAFALLNDVPIWYEIWRNINGFPPDFYVSEKKESKK